MSELEDFYTNRHNQTDWSELTEEHKKAIENTLDYQIYQLKNAVAQFKTECINEFDKLIEFIYRIISKKT